MQARIIILFSIYFIGMPILAFSQSNTIKFTLKTVIEYGLNHQSSMMYYSNKTKITHQKSRQSMANYLPQVSINGGLTDNIKLQQTIIPKDAFYSGSPEQRVAFGSQYNTSITGQITQAIYNQSYLTGIKAIKPNKKFAKLQEDQNKMNLIFTIASNYFKVLVAQEQLRLQEANKKKFDTILAVTKLQVQQGITNPVKLQQVQVNLNNVVSSISSAKNQLESALNNLKNEVGLDLSINIILSDTSQWLNVIPSLNKYPEYNYEQTLESQIQKTQIILYDFQRKSIRANVIPTISAFGKYGANGFGNDFSGAFSPLLDYSAIGLKLSWDIFTGLRHNAEYKESVLVLKNAKLDYQMNKDNLHVQYKNAKHQSMQAQNDLFNNKQNLRLATNLFKNVTIQYQQGIVSLNDLLSAEESYREAKTQYTKALLNFYLADLKVKKVNGSLANFFDNL